MATRKVSTDKMVLAQVALIGENFGSYCMNNFLTFDDMIQYLMSFEDFRVFLPIVCSDRFDVGYFDIIKVDNIASAKAYAVMLRIFEESSALKNVVGSIGASRTPRFSRVPVETISRFVNPRKIKTARMTAHFFLPEMPLRAGMTKFGRIAMERESVKFPISFNLLSIEKHYVEGLSPVIEYFMMTGEVLSIFNVHHINAVEKLSPRILIKALEDLEPKTVALHIRSFEEIPERQRTRMRNRLISMGETVGQHVKASDRRYYRAFLNGFYKVGV